METSIIILNYKTSGLIKNCLRSIYKFPPLGTYEIIVVDNNSQDNSESTITTAFPDVKFIQAHENGGFAKGNNLGVRAAKGEYLFIINPDILITKSIFSVMTEFLKSHPEVGIIGPKLVNPDGSLQYSCTRFPDWKLPFFRRTFLSETDSGREWNKNYLMLEWDHNSDRQVDWLFGAFLATTKSAVEKVGTLDERYFMYMEDLDWCRRFWEKNLEVWYLGTISAIHLHQRDSADTLGIKGLFKKSGRVHIISWLKYFQKFGFKIPDLTNNLKVKK